MFKSLQCDAEMVIDGVIELCYFMRGAVSYEEMMKRTNGERQRIGAFIEKRLKSEAKKPNPQY